MPASSPITRQTVGKTFIVASSALGIIAMTQVCAVAWAFVTRYQKLASESAQGITSTAKAPPPDSPLRPDETLIFKEIPPERPMLPASPSPAIAPPSRPMPVPQAKLEEPPPDTRYQELVQQGRTLRDRGDMNGALTRFREAQTFEPGNAQAIAEIAVTFEKMGLADKASEQWRRIYQMGEAAGTYFIAADARLKQSRAQAIMAARTQAPAPAPTAPSDQPLSRTNPNALLGLGDITSRDENDPNALKKFVLQVPLRARAGGRVDVNDVVIHVLFYDALDEKTIVQTSANVNSHWASTPPDWTDSDTEILEVEYTQPRPDPNDARPENRKYFGYMVRVYYKSELQDMRAEPIRLASQFPAPQTLETDISQ